MAIDKIEIVPYENNYATEWDNFIDGSNDGTIFHKIKFLEYHQKGKFNFHHLIFKKGSRIISVLPGGLSGGVFKSPVGASFGSFVTSNIALSEANEIIKLFVDYCKEHEIEEIFVTPPPVVYQKVINNSVEYAMLYNGFKYCSHLYSSVVDIRSSKGNILNLFDKRARNDVSKARRKGVKIKISDNFNDFYPILLDNKEKFKVVPTHTLDELKRINELLPNSIKLFMAYVEDKPIGGILTFLTNSKTILDFYTAHYYDYRSYSPVIYLLYRILQWVLKNNYEYFDYGVSMNTSSSNPMEPSWNLIYFKESISAFGCLRNTLNLKTR